MNLVTIDGPEDVILGLRDIPDMILVLVTGQALPSGLLRVSAYATDRAIAEIIDRGGTVDVEMDNEQLRLHTEELFQLIESSEPIV